MRTQKSQRIQKLGIQVPHLLIQTQKRKKGNTDQVTDHPLVTWLSCTTHVADHAMIRQ